MCLSILHRINQWQLNLQECDRWGGGRGRGRGREDCGICVKYVKVIYCVLTAFEYEVNIWQNILKGPYISGVFADERLLLSERL